MYRGRGVDMFRPNIQNGTDTRKIKKKHIVLIGGGFAGLNFARGLYNNKFYQVTVVDKNNYNLFTPLLYQVATGFLEPSAISYPFRKLFKKKDINFRMSVLLKVNSRKNKVYLSDGGTLDYDLLVFATGTKTNFYGNKSLRSNSFSVKGIDDALYMRNELIKTLEKASIEHDPLEKQKLLTIVIAGGGATGVELAGMLAELKNCILGMDYPGLANETMRIYLIEVGPNLLGPMSDKTHKAALKEIQKLGIEVKLNTRVNCYGNDNVLLSDGEIIETKTLIWTGGVTANTYDGISLDTIGKGNRMVTDSFNKVSGYDNIYAIGDISIQYADPNYPNGHPQLAQPAIQQGSTLAKNLVLLAKGKEMVPFKYFDRGDMAVIGRKWAVADLFKHRLHVGGLLGLLSWLFIHLISLVNYNNKIKTLYNWSIAFITHDQVLRMVFRSENREREYVAKRKTVKLKNSLLKGGQHLNILQEK
ncbi:MAG: NAD(P)/FAD-dependent oxidoreductase [Sediminicola sp.]